MKSLMTIIYFCMLGVALTACGGTSAATESPTGTPVPPTASPTAAVPTPNISVYLQKDLSGGDAQQGFNVAIAFQCRNCHDSLSRPDRGPQFKAAEDLPPIMARGEQRISDPAYAGQATTNREYIIESIFNPQAHLVAGEWKVEMSEDFAERIEDEELAHLLAWMETFSDTGDSPVETSESKVADEILAIGDPERGREIFMNGGAHESYKPKYACATCHSLDGTVGAEDGAGPSLLGIAARAGERVPGLSAEEYLRQSILDPIVFLPATYNSGMTIIAAKYLSDEELDDVVAFLLALTDNTIHPADIRPAPEVEFNLGMSIAEGNETRGRIAATSYRCLGCHADDEIAGYGPPFSSYEDLPPIMERGELRIADPAYEGQATTNQEYILESIFLPATYILPGEWPENMPNTYHSRLSDDDLANIMIWLATFE